jgi:hypothetical protein
MKKTELYLTIYKSTLESFISYYLNDSTLTGAQVASKATFATQSLLNAAEGFEKSIESGQNAK